MKNEVDIIRYYYPSITNFPEKVNLIFERTKATFISRLYLVLSEKYIIITFIYNNEVGNVFVADIEYEYEFINSYDFSKSKHHIIPSDHSKIFMNSLIDNKVFILDNCLTDSRDGYFALHISMNDQFNIKYIVMQDPILNANSMYQKIINQYSDYFLNSKFTVSESKMHDIQNEKNFILNNLLRISRSHKKGN
jgi:hypothetical protein